MARKDMRMGGMDPVGPPVRFQARDRENGHPSTTILGQVSNFGGRTVVPFAEVGAVARHRMNASRSGHDIPASLGCDRTYCLTTLP